MDVSRIVDEIDAQIAKLQQAKALLTGVPAARTPSSLQDGNADSAPRGGNALLKL